MSDVEFNSKGLDALLKSLKGKQPVGQIGVLGKKNNRTGDTVSATKPTNAEIGAKHEFGNDGMPIRSFLRMPLTEKMQNYLDKSGAFTPDAAKQVIKESSIKNWLEKVLIIGETIISDAFDSGGFGKWKPSNMEHKKNQQTLVETQQLRNSITSRVKE